MTAIIVDEASLRSEAARLDDRIRDEQFVIAKLTKKRDRLLELADRAAAGEVVRAVLPR